MEWRRMPLWSREGRKTKGEKLGREEWSGELQRSGTELQQDLAGEEREAEEVEEAGEK